ncbi:ABC transporter permease [Leptolyngbya sp. FACHB-711]|uniref:ABC transporter permease n=1 Tax=Leptolyngbya sp. ST-U4 TaxID=2933912 RepID=UPI0016850E41|nr:ABC transporter permease [Leptolyngbya sp. FACHB-711]MBD1851720.1 ABC transporter permease [Cyanobacteria bacterium FACHB-502]MBD2024216.1 ABC transporter permease [Leptolyngbya sp. FACHB-711]
MTQAHTSPTLGRLRDPSFWADWTAAVALVLLIIVFSIASPVFLTVGNVQALLLAAAILVVLTIGQTYVILTGGIDLSVASILTLGSVVLGQAYSRGWGIGVACLLAIAAGALLGLINGLVIAKGKITDFIVTLGSLSAAAGAALVLSDGKPVQIASPFLLRFATGGLGLISYFVILAAIIAIIAHIVLFHNRFGTHLLATGGDTEAARATGINTDRMKIMAYMISGCLAGIASIMLTARVGAAEPASNTSFLLNSVAAVVLGGVSLFGGRGTVAGPVIGALLLTALVNGLTLLSVSQFYQPLAVGIVVVLAALLMRYQQ